MMNYIMIENGCIAYKMCERFDCVCYGAVVYKLRSVQNTGTCYPGQDWFVRNLAWGRYAECQMYLTKPVEVFFRGILHKF